MRCSCVVRMDIISLQNKTKNHICMQYCPVQSTIHANVNTVGIFAEEHIVSTRHHHPKTLNMISILNCSALNHIACPVAYRPPIAANDCSISLHFCCTNWLRQNHMTNQHIAYTHQMKKQIIYRHGQRTQMDAESFICLYLADGVMLHDLTIANYI